MKLRKFLRNWHRDIGYLTVGILLIYGISGIMLNHQHDFNPDYRIFVYEFSADVSPKASYSKDEVKKMLAEAGREVVYKKHYMNSQGFIKVFIENGEASINPQTGEGVMRYLQRRALFFEMNQLHRATVVKTWKWISDAFSIMILFVTISGLFILKGKYGLKGRGWWLTLAGFLAPLFFMIFYI